MDYALSSDDILRLCNYKTNLLAYPQLKNYNDIDNVLGDYGCCVILYLTKSKNYGHWVCLIKHDDDKLEFFDSYGIPLDRELGFITKEKRNYLNQNMPYLSKLLYNSPYELIFNDRKIQQNAKDISTCGRHVVCRILNRNIDVDDYIDMLKMDQRYTPDQIVTYLTS